MLACSMWTKTFKRLAGMIVLMKQDAQRKMLNKPQGFNEGLILLPAYLTE